MGGEQAQCGMYQLRRQRWEPYRGGLPVSRSCEDDRDGRLKEEAGGVSHFRGRGEREGGEMGDLSEYWSQSMELVLNFSRILETEQLWFQLETATR